MSSRMPRVMMPFLRLPMLSFAQPITGTGFDPPVCEGHAPR